MSPAISRGRGVVMKNLKLFAVMLLVVVATACGGGGGTTGPTPTPSTPAPQATLLITRPFAEMRRGQFFGAPNPYTSGAGTLSFVARWEPQPPAGQAYLFVVRDFQEAINACYYNYDCPQILAKNISAEHPKRVEYRVQPGEQVFFWIQGIEGTVSGTVEIWFTSDR